MDVALLHPSRFLKSAEFKGKDTTLTITGVQLEELEDENGKKKTKGIVSFKETTKLLVINRTNSDCIKGMFGRETDNWIGKRVTLYPAPFFDNFTKEHTTAIRVKGSPDIKEATTITVHLPRKKPTQVKMARTGVSSAPIAGDELAAEMDAIRAALEPHRGNAQACDAAWKAGIGARIGRLPPAEREVMTSEFKAIKKNEPTQSTEAAP